MRRKSSLEAGGGARTNSGGAAAAAAAALGLVLGLRWPSHPRRALLACLVVHMSAHSHPRRGKSCDSLTNNLTGTH